MEQFIGIINNEAQTVNCAKFLFVRTGKLLNLKLIGIYLQVDIYFL